MRVTLDLLHEFTNTRILGLFHNCMWQSWNRCPPLRNVWTNRLVVQSQRVSPFYLDLHLHLWLCLCLSLTVQQTNWYSRSQERNAYRFPEHSNETFVLSQRVSPFYKLDYGLVGLVGNLLLVEQLLDPIQSSNHFSKKSSAAVEEILILFPLWFLQFPSSKLSGYNRRGVYCEGWWRSIASDRTLILSFEQVWCRPNTPCFDVSSTLYACTVQDAVLPDRSSQDLCVLNPQDSQAERILSVFCSNFGLPVSILNWWWNVNWLHTQCDKCTWRNRLESRQCLVMKDQ